MLQALKLPIEIIDGIEEYNKVYDAKIDEYFSTIEVHEYQYQKVEDIAKECSTLFAHVFDAQKKFYQTTTDYDTEEINLNDNNIYPLDLFKELVATGGFIDYDGFGYYMLMETIQTNIHVKPSHITNGYGRG